MKLMHTVIHMLQRPNANTTSSNHLLWQSPGAKHRQRTPTLHRNCKRRPPPASRSGKSRSREPTRRHTSTWRQHREVRERPRLEARRQRPASKQSTKKAQHLRILLRAELWRCARPAAGDVVRRVTRRRTATVLDAQRQYVTILRTIAK